MPSYSDFSFLLFHSRFFVVEQDNEYRTWTREIEKVIAHHSAVNIGAAAGQRVIDSTSGVLDLTPSVLSGEDDSKSKERSLSKLDLKSSTKSMERSMLKAMDASALAFKIMDAKAKEAGTKAFKAMDASATASMGKAREASAASAAAFKAVMSSSSPIQSPSGGTRDTKNRLQGLGSVLRMSRAEDSKKMLENAHGAEGGAKKELINETESEQDTIDGATLASTASLPFDDQPESNGPIPVEEEIDDSNLQADSKNRGLQLRGKIAGVGQVTKGWGSAILSGRQKGKPTNTPPVSDNALHVISEKEDVAHVHNEAKSVKTAIMKWTCSQCTFINEKEADQTDTDILICAMCEFPMERASTIVEITTKTSDTLTNKSADEKAEKTEQVGSLDVPVKGEGDPDKGIFRRSQSEVNTGRSRIDSTDSGKGLYLRQASDSLVEFVEEDEASVISDLALDEYSESARSGGRRRGMLNRVSGALGSVRRSKRASQPVAIPASSSESESKGWFGRRSGTTSSSQDSGTEVSKPSAQLKLKNARIDETADVILDGTRSIVDIPLQKLEGHWYALVKPSSDDVMGEKLSPGPTQVSSHELLALNESGDDELSRTRSVDGDAASAARSGASVQSGPSKTDETILKTLFHIQLIHQNLSETTRQPKAETVKGLAEITKLHADISESISEVMHHPFFQETSFERTESGELSLGLKNVLGLSPLDSLQISSQLLAGLLDPSVSKEGAQKAEEHYCKDDFYLIGLYYANLVVS